MSSKRTMIPYGRQLISDEDVQAVVDILRSDWLTQGPTIGIFENTIATFCGSTFGVAVNSATSALHIACLALGLEKGDWLWTTPNTFVASANCARYCGANVDFIDIDPATFNMNCESLEDKLKTASNAGTLPKVVVPVHFGGLPCDMSRIKSLADKYGFYIIEDASHAIGAKYQDGMVGNSEFSDMTVFSFHPVKIITSAEGGMVLTNNRQFFDKLVRFRSHGITRDPQDMPLGMQGAWDYNQIDLGYNYRMTDIQAALGLSQFERLHDFISRRRAIAEVYTTSFADLPFSVQFQPSDVYSAFHLFAIKLDEDCKLSRLEAFNELRSKGIGVNVHYIPVHLQPYYRALGFKDGDFPESENYYKHALSLPLYAGLTGDDQDYVIETVISLLCES